MPPCPDPTYSPLHRGRPRRNLPPKAACQQPSRGQGRTCLLGYRQMYMHGVGGEAGRSAWQHIMLWLGLAVALAEQAPPLQAAGA